MLPSDKNVTLMPLVSIISALHNKAAFIAETIASVQAQSMTSWEMLIIENGSTDGGADLAEKIARKDDRVQLIRAPNTVQGPGAARNYGITRSVGDWILFLDADDLMEVDHLKNLLAASRSMSSANVIAGCWKEFENDGLRNLITHRPATYGFLTDFLLPRAAALAPWILHAAIVKRETIIRGNFWPECLDQYPDEDTAFWFQILEGSEVGWTDSSGALYRKIYGNSRSNEQDLGKRLRAYEEIVSHNLEIARRRNIVLDSCAHEHISMMFEVIYRRAMNEERPTIATRALSLSEKHLHQASKCSIRAMVRKWLGIANINRLRNTYRRIRPTS